MDIFAKILLHVGDLGVTT